MISRSIRAPHSETWISNQLPVKLLNPCNRVCLSINAGFSPQTALSQWMVAAGLRMPIRLSNGTMHRQATDCFSVTRFGPSCVPLKGFTNDGISYVNPKKASQSCRDLTESARSAGLQLGV